MDLGDFVIVLNADKIVLTGKNLVKRCIVTIQAIQVDVRRFRTISF